MHIKYFKMWYLGIKIYGIIVVPEVRDIMLGLWLFGLIKRGYPVNVLD